MLRGKGRLIALVPLAGGIGVAFGQLGAYDPAWGPASLAFNAFARVVAAGALLAIAWRADPSRNAGIALAVLALVAMAAPLLVSAPAEWTRQLGLGRPPSTMVPYFAARLANDLLLASTLALLATRRSRLHLPVTLFVATYVAAFAHYPPFSFQAWPLLAGLTVLSLRDVATRRTRLAEAWSLLAIPLAGWALLALAAPGGASPVGIGWYGYGASAALLLFAARA